jgi:redox-sensitive bicupin YhaK (pirin superfamily)
MAPKARFTLPRALTGTNRSLFFFRGESIEIGGRAFRVKTAVKVQSDVDVPIENGPAPSELLLLQGKPVGEPIVQYGPFVMNTRAEIQQAIADYQRTQFGGWPWPSHGPVHAKAAGRFAKHADGRREDV